MKTNKKLKLNTKKVVILSDEQQSNLEGGRMKVYTEKRIYSCRLCSERNQCPFTELPC
ncbi:hypothetical protein WAF17_18025 [Bernardetia sp. ABR2-2B]|uniref:hypothetical protein n=1 Tax=Bernardetia sp. ABR2-2B TaxID=3127472 RepID=UPI0030CB12D4